MFFLTHLHIIKHSETKSNAYWKCQHSSERECSNEWMCSRIRALWPNEEEVPPFVLQNEETLISLLRLQCLDSSPRACQAPCWFFSMTRHYSLLFRWNFNAEPKLVIIATCHWTIFKGDTVFAAVLFCLEFEYLKTYASRPMKSYSAIQYAGYTVAPLCGYAVISANATPFWSQLHHGVL